MTPPLRLLRRLLALWLIATAAHAQLPEHFTLRGKRVKIPFETYNNLIVVPVQVNGSETLNFILDTGAGLTLITDPRAARFLQQPFVRTLSIAGMGDDKDAELLTSVSIDNTILLGKSESRRRNVLALQEDVLALSEYVGVPIHGILGCNLFENTVMEINFRRGVIVLHDPLHYRPRRRKGQRYDIDMRRRKPYARIEATVAGQRLDLNVLLDTGASHALLLDSTAHAGLELPAQLIPAELGRGLSGVIYGHVGRIDGVRLGGATLDDVLTSFPTRAMHTYRADDRQGNVGCELLNRFVVTFHFPERYVHFRPLRRQIRQPFERDMSGLELRAVGDDFSTFVVNRVAHASPAAEAGLHPGDEIMYVDNLSAKELQLANIYDLLQKKAGRKITLLVRRDGALLVTTLVLRRLI
ncbi:MAG: aspartyl protease family protein [Catalinimonas sp.]